MGARRGVRVVLVPSRQLTAHILRYASFVMLTYMFLLTMFELIELLRPKEVAGGDCEPRAPCCPICNRRH